jgi:hypothetical protein
MGFGPAARDRVERRRAGVSMMCAEITGVSQCRGGLAPAASLTDRRRGRAASAALSCRVPWAAAAGSQACPVVMTACRCRKIAAAMTVCAWVGVSLFSFLLARCASGAAGVHRARRLLRKNCMKPSSGSPTWRMLVSGSDMTTTSATPGSMRCWWSEPIRSARRSSSRFASTVRTLAHPKTAAEPAAMRNFSKYWPTQRAGSTSSRDSGREKPSTQKLLTSPRRTPHFSASAGLVAV